MAGQLITSHWTSVSDQQKEEMRNFLLDYLAKNGRGFLESSVGCQIEALTSIGARPWECRPWSGCSAEPLGLDLGPEIEPRW